MKRKSILGFLIVLSFMLFSTPLYAKTQKKVVVAKVQMNTNSYTMLKRVNKKIKWKSNNKKMVEILPGDKILVHTKNVKGKCALTGKLKNKTYKYIIQVKKATKPVNQTVALNTISEESGYTLKVKLSSTSGIVSYGSSWYLEKKTGETWNQVDVDKSLAFDCALYNIYGSNGKPVSCTLSYNLLSQFNKETLTKGEYRIHISGNWTCEFTVK